MHVEASLVSIFRMVAISTLLRVTFYSGAFLSAPLVQTREVGSMVSQAFSRWMSREKASTGTLIP